MTVATGTAAIAMIIYHKQEISRIFATINNVAMFMPTATMTAAGETALGAQLH
jgi:hypothetical protein